MTAADVLRIVAGSTAVFLLGAVGLALLRGREAAVRSALLRGVVGAVLALPVAAAVLPRWEVPFWLSGAAPAPGMATALGSEEAGTRVLRVRVGPAAREESAAAGAGGASVSVWPIDQDAWHPAAVAGVLWSAGALLLLLRCGWGMAAVVRLRRGASPVHDPGLRHALTAAQRAVGLRSSPRLLECPALSSPAACGVLRPAILLPPGRRSWSHATLRAVLIHEAAHLRRRDPTHLLLAAVARALYWPHPGVWWTTLHMGRESERACDEAVVATGTDPGFYAAELTRLARNSRRPLPTPPAHLLTMASPGTLERRVRELLSSHAPARTRRSAQWAAAALPVAAALMLAAAEPRVPPPVPGGTAAGGAAQADAPRWARIDVVPAGSGAAGDAPRGEAGPGTSPENGVVAEVEDTLPARLAGPLSTGWRSGGRRYDAEVLGTFSLARDGKLTAETSDAVLRVWQRSGTGPDRLYLAAATRAGVQLSVGWTGSAEAAPDARERALWRRIIPDLLTAAAQNTAVDTVLESEREEALAYFRGAPVHGFIDRDRQAFTTLVRDRLAAILPPALAAEVEVLEDVALELWTELHVTVFWPTGTNGPEPNIGIQGNAHLTLIHGQGPAPVVEVSTRGGPLSQRLPAAVEHRFAAVGARVDEETAGRLREAGAALAAAWEAHYENRRGER